MNEGWLLSCFLIFLVFALGVALYPLRKSRAGILFLAPVLILLAGLAYWTWGAWPAWTHYLQEDVKQQRIQTLLKSMHDPAELIATLKVRLQKQPDSARGWYLLGRLYSSQNQWQQARDAFATAHRLQPTDEQFTVNYVQNLWQLNHQTFDDSSRDLLKGVLANNANQPDALAMLAMDAYTRHEYQQAIDYWQDLLKLAPPQSEEAGAIRKAIAKAQRMIPTPLKASP